MRRAAALALSALIALPVQAAEEGGAKAKEGKAGKPGTNVDMPFLMAPMLNADGKLTGYAYISSRLTATSDAYALDVREKLAFVQDAFVRDINGAAVTLPGDLATVDVPGVEARLLADAKRVVGAAKVKSITVCTVQVAPLHPVQSPAAPPPEGSTQKSVPKTRCA